MLPQRGCGCVPLRLHACCPGKGSLWPPQPPYEVYLPQPSGLHLSSRVMTPLCPSRTAWCSALLPCVRHSRHSKPELRPPESSWAPHSNWQQAGLPAARVQMQAELFCGCHEESCGSRCMQKNHQGAQARPVSMPHQHAPASAPLTSQSCMSTKLPRCSSRLTAPMCPPTAARCSGAMPSALNTSVSCSGSCSPRDRVFASQRRLRCANILQGMVLGAGGRATLRRPRQGGSCRGASMVWGMSTQHAPAGCTR